MAANDKVGMDSSEYWELLIKKSVSRYLLLDLLSKKPMHGYDIAKSIEACCERWCKPTDGMIYPTLKELVKGGYIEGVPQVVGGRRRKVCHLTAKGVEAHRTAARVWADVLPYLQASVRQALSEAERGDETSGGSSDRTAVATAVG